MRIEVEAIPNNKAVPCQCDDRVAAEKCISVYAWFSEAPVMSIPLCHNCAKRLSADLQRNYG